MCPWQVRDKSKRVKNEVECFKIFRYQKVAENMNFGVSNWILGNLNGKSVNFMTYQGYSLSLPPPSKREIFEGTLLPVNAPLMIDGFFCNCDSSYQYHFRNIFSSSINFFLRILLFLYFFHLFKNICLYFQYYFL